MVSIAWGPGCCRMCCPASRPCICVKCMHASLLLRAVQVCVQPSCCCMQG